MSTKYFIKIVTIITIFCPTLVFAKVGMPQLNPESFYSQIFWLIISFSILYWIMAKFILPKISITLRSRRDKILNDLDSAEELKKKSEEILKNYENLLLKEKEKRQTIIKKAMNNAEKSFNDKITNIESSCNARIKETEEKITAARLQAKESIKNNAISISDDIVTKVVGLKLVNKDSKLLIEELFKRNRYN